MFWGMCVWTRAMNSRFVRILTSYEQRVNLERKTHPHSPGEPFSRAQVLRSGMRSILSPLFILSKFSFEVVTNCQ